MAKLSRQEALEALHSGGELPALARAVALLADDPATAAEELLPALDHPGYVAEQAAIALHRMTGTPWPEKHQPIVSRRFWELRLEPQTQKLFAECAEGSQQLLAKVLARAAAAPQEPQKLR